MSDTSNNCGAVTVRGEHLILKYKKWSENQSGATTQ
jgi:hypothetical protein